MGTVHLEKEGGVAVLTVDSVEVKNGLTPDGNNRDTHDPSPINSCS